ncbi:MAG: hypothetical protein WCB63_06095 [Polyangiales bacterium]
MKTPVHVLLTALLLAATACSVYDSSLVEKGLAGVPVRPPSSTSSEADEVEVIFALRNVSLDQSGDRWRRFGLDLDGSNTKSIVDDAECVAANGHPPLDGDNGIDNAFGQYVLPTVASLVACLEDNIALHQGCGRGTVLLRLRNWNGTPNDAKVDVSTFSAVDGTSLDDVSDLQWGGDTASSLLLPGSANEAPDPAWDGDDYFFVDPSTLITGNLDRPVIWQTDAYVSNGRVVLPLDAGSTFVFLTGPGSFSIAINGFMIADISQDGQTIEKGLIAGRFPAGKLVGALEPLGVCDETFQGSILGLLTDNLDLHADPNVGSPDDQCTATGIAFSFQGIRARIADTAAPVELPKPDPCAGAGGGPEPAFDRCCRSVEMNSPNALPADCSAEDLQPYSDLPNPIPVPLEAGF